MAFALSQVLVTRIRSRRVIVALVLGVFFLLHHREAPTLPVPITGYGPLTHLSSGGLTPSGSLPLVTLIVVFNGKDFHRFTPYFLESVRRQKALELVIVQRGDECSDLKNWTKMARNIRHACLSEKDFWAMHSEYLCDRWGGCSKQQRKQMVHDMVALGKIKAPQSYYPLLRGGVFATYVSPHSIFWGFCDMDIALGDWSRTFPFDIAMDDYDIVTTSQHNPAGGDSLVFMRGHLTLVRNRPETEAKIMGYEFFVNYSEWEMMGRPTAAVEEVEYSHYIVGRPDINMFIVDGLAPGGAPVLTSSASGILTLPESLRPSKGAEPSLSPMVLRSLSQPLPAEVIHSFTPDGIESSVNVLQTPPPEGISLWFEKEYASWYTQSPAPRTFGKWRRYLMKRNGRWTERLEPIKDWAKGTALEGAQEWLYVHFQEEKRMAHFYELESKPVDVFVSYYYDGTAGFNLDGRMIFWLPRRPETCTSEGCVEVGETPIDDRPEFRAWLDSMHQAAKDYVESKRLRLGLPTPVFDEASGHPQTVAYKLVRPTKRV